MVKQQPPKLQDESPNLSRRAKIYYEMREIKLIKIRRDQRFKLEKQFGFKVGREIQRTYSKPKHYYLREDSRCLKALNEIK